MFVTAEQGDIFMLYFLPQPHIKAFASERTEVLRNYVQSPGKLFGTTDSHVFH